MKTHTIFVPRTKNVVFTFVTKTSSTVFDNIKYCNNQWRGERHRKSLFVWFLIVFPTT